MDKLEKPGANFTVLARHKNRTVTAEDGTQSPQLQWFTKLTWLQMSEVVPGEWVEIDPAKWKVPAEAIEADKSKADLSSPDKSKADLSSPDKPKADKPKADKPDPALEKMHNSIGLKGAARHSTEDLIFYAENALGLKDASKMTKKDLIDHIEKAMQ